MERLVIPRAVDVLAPAALAPPRVFAPAAPPRFAPAAFPRFVPAAALPRFAPAAVLPRFAPAAVFPRFAPAAFPRLAPAAAFPRLAPAAFPRLAPAAPVLVCAPEGAVLFCAGAACWAGAAGCAAGALFAPPPPPPPLDGFFWPKTNAGISNRTATSDTPTPRLLFVQLIGTLLPTRSSPVQRKRTLLAGKWRKLYTGLPKPGNLLIVSWIRRNQDQAKGGVVGFESTDERPSRFGE